MILDSYLIVLDFELGPIFQTTLSLMKLSFSHSFVFPYLSIVNYLSDLVESEHVNRYLEVIVWHKVKFLKQYYCIVVILKL